MSPLVVLADVVEAEQVGVLEVEALADAAELDVEIAADQLQGDFLAGVADGVVDLAEAALADAALDRVALQRPRAAGVSELAQGGTRLGRVLRLRGMQVHRILTYYFYSSRWLVHLSTNPELAAGTVKMVA